MTISNEAFANGLVTALQIADVDARKAAVVDLIDDWNGGSLSNAKLAAAVSAFEVLVSARDSDISAWAVGAATTVISDPAGQPAPGFYPIRIVGGALVWIPSIGKLQVEMLKGEPAQTGFVVEVFGKPAPNVVIARFVAPGDMVFTNAGCIGDAEAATTTMQVYAITKNGILAGNASYAPGSSLAVFDLTGGQLAAVRGDVIRVISPAEIDLTLLSPTLTFAGDP